MQLAACIIQCAACIIQRAARNIQHATYSIQHTTCSMHPHHRSDLVGLYLRDPELLARNHLKVLRNLPSPGADVAALSPAPAQMRHAMQHIEARPGRADSRRLEQQAAISARVNRVERRLYTRKKEAVHDLKQRDPTPDLHTRGYAARKELTVRAIRLGHSRRGRACLRDHLCSRRDMQSMRR
jgi:hypothetical protein